MPILDTGSWILDIHKSSIAVVAFCILRGQLRGVFSESRKILPHSIERQLGPGTLPSTAPEDVRLREGGLLCLHHAPDHGLGGVRQALKNLCCGSLKRPPSTGL
jgi:hypothetical protein